MPVKDQGMVNTLKLSEIWYMEIKTCLNILGLDQKNNGTSTGSISFSSSELRATSFKVSVVREKFNNNQWVSDGYSDGLARKIEDLILTRARELRIKNS